MIKKKKQGELTTQQIVIITVMIASFAVILFFLVRLNLGEQTNAEICHSSVILKSKSSILTGGGSLNCKTSYVCFSGGGDCTGVNPTETIQVQPQNKELIMKTIADEMAQCWWMFGEGKVDYTSNINVLGNKFCAVCSSLHFDETLKQNKISYQEFYNYLEKTPKDNSQTYLKYLYGTSSLRSIPSLQDTLKENIDFSSKYVIITGMTKEGIISWDNAKAASIPLIYFLTDDKKTNAVIQPILIKSKDVSKYGCDEFITKA